MKERFPNLNLIARMVLMIRITAAPTDAITELYSQVHFRFFTSQESVGEKVTEHFRDASHTTALPPFDLLEV